MRDSLTVLAILLIGVLTAALVGPYIVDWGAHRALIERRLSEAAGVPVTVGGAIDLKILPTPRFAFADVAIGDGKAGRPRLTVGELQAVVSFTALLRGQVQVMDTTLVRPRLDIVQARDGSFDLALPSERGADRVAVDHVGIREGTIDVALSDGRRFALDDIGLDGEATSLRGPFKAAGRIGVVPFRLAAGTVDRGRFRLKLHLDGAASRPAIDFDGIAAAQPAATGRAAADPAGAAGPNIEGTVTLAGAVPLEGTPAVVPWALTGRVTADRDAALATDLEWRAGTDMRALVAGGEGHAAYGAGEDLPAVALDLHGAAVDLDRLAVAPDDGSIAPPEGTDLLALLARAARGGGIGTAMPLRLDLKARFDTATVAGRALLGPSLRLGLGPEPTAALAFGVGGPQGARLEVDGRADLGPSRPVSGPFGAAPTALDPMFRGRAELRSTDLRRTAAWLAPLCPDIAAALAALPGRNVVASGDIEASGTGLVARALSLGLDGSVFGGTLSLTRAVGDERGRIFADLTAQALVLDRLTDLSSIATAANGLDLDLALAARAVTVMDAERKAGAGRPGPLAVGNLALKLTRRGDETRLDRLSLDLDGAAVTATASRSATGGRADLAVSAPHVEPLLRSFGDLLPSELATALRSRAGLLSPLDATLHVEAEGSGGTLAPTRLAVKATAAGSHVEVGVTPEAATDGRDQPRPLAVELRATAEDGAELLRQIGIPAAAGLGPARIEARARGSVAAGGTFTLESAAGGTTLAASGRGDATRGDGRFRLTSTDLRPVLASLGGAPATGAVPADAAADVAADVSWDAGTVALRDLQAHGAGVTATGALDLDLAAPRRAPGGEPVPQIKGRLALDRLPVSALVALAFGPSAALAPGVTWSAVPFGAPALILPTSAVALTVDAMPLMGSLEARKVRLGLETRPNAVALTAATGRLGIGTVGGALALRHDATGDTLSGYVDWTDIALDVGGFTGRTTGRQDLAASGASPAALIASLSGAGTLAVTGAALAETDPVAPGAVAAAIAARDVLAERASASPNATAIDTESLKRDLAARLARAALPIGDARVPDTLAGGLLRIGPLRTSGTAEVPKAEPMPWSADTTVAVDVGALTLSSRTALRGAAGSEVVVTRTGPLAGPQRRDLEVAGLLGAIQAQAIARAQERIDVMEQDIRERAAFNRQLKAIQADQEAARTRAVLEAKARADQAKAEAQARRAEAERARADEIRVRAEIEAAARAAVDRQRATPLPPPSIPRDGGIAVP